MEARLHAPKVVPAINNAMEALEKTIRSAVDPRLLELIKLRASQINGCAYCIELHSKDARAKGESEQRLYLLNAWHESPLYTERERAALAWTEAVTLISDGHAPDDVYAELRRHFNAEETASLTAAIGMINLWNRMAIALRYVHAGEKVA